VLLASLSVEPVIGAASDYELKTWAIVAGYGEGVSGSLLREVGLQIVQIACSWSVQNWGFLLVFGRLGGC